MRYTLRSRERNNHPYVRRSFGLCDNIHRLCSLSARSTVLLNTEVYEVLKDRGGLNTDRYSRALPVEKQAAQYLREVLNVSGNVDNSNVKCKAALSDLALGSADVVQILNLRPRSILEVFLIIEDLEDRLGDEADAFAEKILAVVEEYFPVPDAGLTKAANE